MFDLPRAAFFDVDGVLVDSLPQHLQVCRDKAQEFGLALSIPGTEQMRRRISHGLKVSPMLNFFLAVGFPPADAARAVEDYEREFMQRYHPAAFPAVDVMLAKLRAAGLRLGLVTSNTRANVAPALGAAMQYFEQSCQFFFDEYAPSMTKTECLVEGARRMALPASACAYVGDQPADETAAREAGLRFLGVTYGWGITQSGARFEIAKSVGEIPDKLVGMHAIV